MAYTESTLPLPLHLDLPVYLIVVPNKNKFQRGKKWEMSVHDSDCIAFERHFEASVGNMIQAIPGYTPEGDR